MAFTDTEIAATLRINVNSAVGAALARDAEALTALDERVQAINARLGEQYAAIGAGPATASTRMSSAVADAEQVVTAASAREEAAIQQAADSIAASAAKKAEAITAASTRAAAAEEESAARVAAARARADAVIAESSNKIAASESRLIAVQQELAAKVEAAEARQAAAVKTAADQIEMSEARKAAAAQAAGAKITASDEAATTGTLQRAAKASQSLGGIGASARAAGALVGGLAGGFELAGIAAAAISVKMAMDFDTAQHHVLAFTNTSQEQLKQVTATVQALSVQTGTSATDLMNSYYGIASSGLDAARSQKILQESIMFATASETDASVATGLLTGIVNAYHLSLRQIPQAQDDVAQAVKIGTMEAQDYAPALAQIIPTAAHLGVGLKELGGYFAVLTNNGINAAESGVYIGNMLNRLLNPTYQQIRAVEALGGSYGDLTVKGGKVTPTLERINELVIHAVPNIKSLENAHGDLTRRQQIFIEQMQHADSRVSQLFGGNTEAMKAFFALMANGGEQTHRALNQMGNDAGTTQHSFDIMNESEQKQWDRSIQQIAKLSREVGQDLAPAILEAAKAAAFLASTLGSDWITKLQERINQLSFDIHDKLFGWMPAAKAQTNDLLQNYGKLTEQQRLMAEAQDEEARGFGKAAERLRDQARVLDDRNKAVREQLSLQHQMTTAQGAGPSVAPGAAPSRFVLDTAAMARASSNLDNYGAQAQTALKAFADALLWGDKHTRAYGAAAIAAAEKQKRVADSLDKANLLIARAMGDYSAQLQIQQTRLKTGADQATAALVLAIYNHAGNIGQLTEVARQRVGDQQKLADAQTEADRLIAAGAQSVTQAFDSLSKRLQDRSTSALDGLVLAIYNHTGGIHQLTETARQAAADQKRFSDAQVEAARLIAPAAHDVVQAFDDLSKQMQDKSTSAFDRLVLAMHNGSGGIDQLTRAAAQAAQGPKRFADETDAARLKVARASGDWATVLDLTRQQLEGAAQQAQARLVADQRAGNRGAIPADMEAVTRTRDTLDQFNRQVTAAGTAGERVAKSFSDLQSAADKNAKTALDALALNFKSGQGDFEALRAKAVSTAEAVQSYSDARAAAEQTVNDALKRTTNSFTVFEDALRTGANQALDTYIMMLQRGNNSSRDMNAAWQNVISTSVDLAKAEQLRNEVNRQVVLSTGSVADKMDLLKNDLDQNLRNAIAQSVKDLLDHGRITKQHEDALKRSAVAVQHNADAVEKVNRIVQSIQTPQMPSGRLDKERQDADQRYNDALARVTLDIEHHGSATRADVDALRLASESRDDLSKAEADAAKTIADVGTSVRDFGAYLQGLQTALDADLNTLANFLLHPNLGSAPAPEPATVVRQGRAEGVPRESNLNATLDQAVQDAQNLHEAQTKRLQAEVLVDQRIGDTAGALSAISQLFAQGKVSLQQYIDADVANAKNQQVIDEGKRQADLAAAKATGDTAAALKLTTDAYYDNKASLQDVIDATNTDAAAQARHAQQTMDLDRATGNYSDLLTQLTHGPQADYANSLAGVTIAIHDHGQATQDDINATILARQATEGWTRAQWDATFATASLADRQKMLNSLVSDMVSQRNTVEGAQSSVDSANLAVIAAQSALEVDQLKAQTSAVQSLASVMTAQQAVQKATFDGQIAAVNDQTSIIKDTYALQQATDPASLRVAQLQLQIDQVTMQQHQVEAAWARRIAEDQLRLAQDKARADQANAAAQIQVQMDNLKIAVDNRQTALDQQKMTLDQLIVLNDIDSTIGAVNDFTDLIRSDLDAISKDRAQTYQDQQQLAADSAAAALAQQQGAMQEAQGNLILVRDQGGAAAADQAYQLQLAGLTQQQAIAQILQQQYQKQQQDAAANNANQQKMIDELQAQRAQDNANWARLFALYTTPQSRENIVGDESTQDFLDSRGLAAQSVGNVSAR